MNVAKHPALQGVTVHFVPQWRESMFPDNAEGAAACLRSISIFKTLKEVKCRPDPSVQGVWEVKHTHKGQAYRHIVYLAGYPDPFGNIRKHDDFETNEE